MEDLLLILLGLVWLGLTLYRNSQKKKQQQERMAGEEEADLLAESEDDGKDAGTLLEELFGDSLYSGPMTEEEQEDATLVKASGRKPFIYGRETSDPNVVSMETIEFPTRYESLEDLFEDEGDLTKVKSELDEDVYNISEEEEEETDEPEFDLKRAVIYSEILKRPEF